MNKFYIKIIELNFVLFNSNYKCENIGYQTIEMLNEFFTNLLCLFVSIFFFVCVLTIGKKIGVGMVKITCLEKSYIV